LLTNTSALTPKPEQNEPANTVLTVLTDKAWQKKYFNNESCSNLPICGEDADPDRDGQTNQDEYKLGTDPNNPDSDTDGLADGDESHVFGSNPMSAHSGKDQTYTDADYLKGGYNFVTDAKFTKDELSAITAKMKQNGLHHPTTVTLKDSLISIYSFTDWKVEVLPTASSTASSTLPGSSTATSSALSGVDVSLEAKQDRDAQRSATISTVGIALTKYYTDYKAYPKPTSFSDMFTSVKPYIKVATNPTDPINKDPYVYGYSLTADNADFTLSFYSEVAGQLIKKHAADAQKSLNDQEAGVYDDQRKGDLEMIKTALLLYSNKNAAGNQDYVFPTEAEFKKALVPAYISEIPKDPKTDAQYEYQVSDTFDTFTIKALLDNPPKGTTGYVCNQDECRNY
jgi:hypothetical protein